MANHDHRAGRKASSSPPSCPPMLEQLEPRLLLSGTTFLVNSLASESALDGFLTFTEAVRAANTDAQVNEAPAGSGHDVIRFDEALFAAGPQTIIPDSYGGITDDVTIVGPGHDLLTLDSLYGDRHLYIDTGVTAHISGLSMTGVNDTWGGAVRNKGNLEMNDVEIYGCSSYWGGGGIRNEGVLVLSNATIRDNQAPKSMSDGGGGIYNSGTITILHSAIYDNWTDDIGGGISNDGTLVLINSTVSNNEADFVGGGISNYDNTSVCLLRNSTIVDNRAKYSAAGIDINTPSCTIYNSLIARNRTTYTGSRFTAGPFDIEGAVSGGSSYNLVSDAAHSGGLSDGNNGNIIGVGNLSWLGSLSWNGGDTKTHALADGSPAIDAGSGARAVDQYGTPLVQDQRGWERVADGNNDGSAVVDIGAYEGFSTKPPTDVTNFQSVAGDGQVELSWTNPSDSGLAGVIIVRRAGSTPAAGPSNGVAYSVGSSIGGGTVIYASSGTSYIDTDVINGTLYYYEGWAYDASLTYSGTHASAQATPQKVNLPPEVSLLRPDESALLDDTTPTFSWDSTDPDDDELVATLFVDTDGDPFDEPLRSWDVGLASSFTPSAIEALDLGWCYSWGVQVDDGQGHVVNSEVRYLTISETDPQYVVLAWDEWVPVEISRDPAHWWELWQWNEVYRVNEQVNMAPAAVSETFKALMLQNVQNIFGRSGTEGLVVTDSPQEEAETVYFAPWPEEDADWSLSGKAYTGLDQFNEDHEGEAVVFLYGDTFDHPDLADYYADTVAHEVGHLLGLRHVNPAIDDDPFDLEVMDYDNPYEFTRQSSGMFVNAVTDIWDRGSTDTHNPAYHLNRYIDGISSEDLVGKGIIPGTWDTSSVEMVRTRVDIDLEETLYRVHVQGGFPCGDSGGSLNTVAYYEQITPAELAEMVFLLPEGSLFRVLGASVEKGPLDMVLSVGDPQEESNTLFTVAPETVAGKVVKGTPDGYEELAPAMIEGTTGIEVSVGDGAAKSATYTDNDGTTITVSLKNGTGELCFTGDNLQQAASKKGVVVTGSNIALAEIALFNTTAKGALTVKTKGGDGLATVGQITGSDALGKLSGKTVDLTGEGIVLTDDGYITSIQVHDLKNGADIIMPGTDATKGVTIKAGMLYPDTDIVLGSYLRSLTAVQWVGSSLTTPWASSISIKGDRRNGIAGDLGADLTFTGADPKKGLALSKLAVAGTITDSVITANSGSVGIITAAQWDSGSLDALWAKNIMTKGNRRDLNITGDFDFGATLNLTGQDTRGMSLNKLQVAGKILDSQITLSGAAGTIMAAQWDDGSLNAAWAKTVMTKGNRDPSITGDFGATLNLTGQDTRGMSLNKLQVAGTARNSAVRTAGSMGSLLLGATDSSDFLAGISDDVTRYAANHADFENPLASIKSVKIKGIKGAAGRFFEDTNISASALGTVSILNADFVNGECGLYACDADGDREIRRVSYRDTESGEQWAWPAKGLQVFAGRDEFIRIL